MQEQSLYDKTAAQMNRVGGDLHLAPLTPQLQACRSAPGGS